MRNDRHSQFWQTLAPVVLALVVVPGCGSAELSSATAAKLKALATLYLDYAVAKRGNGPSSEQVLKKHMRSLPDFILQMNGVDPSAIDSVFVSDRDQEQFVVLYGLSISGISGTSAPVLAYEKSGKNGKRLIVFVNTKVDHVDEARLQGLTSAKP